ncbi:MAG: hypothetical protein DWQ08_04365 [Proteobacteria bacterium]|nr:MAG: hypothetical protein DWQ08_04365 [Pseudomonadota bacterium]
MQALGEHEEDIASLEASIPLYDAVLKVLTRDNLPMLWAMVAANRASAMLALADESDYLDMAEASAAEFRNLVDLFDGTDYSAYKDCASEQVQRALNLIERLQV